MIHTLQLGQIGRRIIGASSAATVPYLFDVLTGATPTYAYGLRKLFSTYSGYALRLRRSSDNALLNIGFVGSDLDTATMLAHCGAGSGYVETWYDQAGTSNWVQSTNGAQPRIVNAGVLETLTTGKPTMVFDGVDDIFVGSANTIGQPMTRNMVAKFISVASGQNIASDGVSNSVYFPSSGAIATYAGASFQFKSGVSAGDTASMTERLYTPSADGTFNGTTVGGAAGSASTLRQNLGGSSSGGAGSAFTNMSASEYIFWASVSISDPRLAILGANQKAYWGTP